MAKIQFTLEAWLKDKSQKVETGEGESVRILCTNAEGVLPIIGNVGEESENLQRWTEKGQYRVGLNTPDKDLFLVTQDEGLSEFEKCLVDLVSFSIRAGLPDDGDYETALTSESVRFAKRYSEKLLSLAREQFIKDGYVIEKKAFHDAVENISDKHRAEMSVEYSIHCKVKDGTRNAIMNWDTFQKVAQKFIDIGKAEALKDLQEGFANNDIYRVPEWLREVLVMAKENGKKEVMKDLPRWKLYRRGTEIDPLAVVRFKEGTIGRARYAVDDCYVLDVKDLLKLPGFKED